MNNSKKFLEFLWIGSVTGSTLEGLQMLQEKKNNGEAIIDEIDIVKENSKKAIDSKKEWLEKNSKMFPKEVYEKLQTTLSNMIQTTEGLTETYLDASVTVMNGFNNTISKIFEKNLEEIVTYSIDVGEMSLDDYKNLLSTEYITPEYKSALQDIINKKEKQMAEQTAVKEEKGNLSYAERIEEIKKAYGESKDVEKFDAAMKDILFEMHMSGDFSNENLALLDSARELRTKKEEPKKEEQPEKKDATVDNKNLNFSDVTGPRTKVDPVLQMLDELGVSAETKERILNLDKEKMLAVEYAQMVNEYIYGDKIASINKEINALEAKRDSNNKLSFIDNVRLSSLIGQRTQLMNGLNLSLQQKINLLVGAKKDEKIIEVENDILKATEKFDKTKNKLAQRISKHKIGKLNERLKELRAKNLEFNGEQLKTEIGTFDKKAGKLKLKSDFIAFNAEIGKNIAGATKATLKAIKSVPGKINDLRNRYIAFKAMPVNLSEEDRRTYEEIQNNRTR